MNRNRRIPVLMAILAISALACGPAATVVVTATPEPAATPPQVGEASPAPTTAAGCALGARWVADVTVPDNTAFAPGTAFVKTWRVRNSGTCNWEPGTKLVFVSGDGMSGPGWVDVPALAAGAQTDVSVSLVAPATPGTYRANYQFQAPDGTRFGPVIWVQIVVPAPATATSPPPTAAPTEAPTVPPPTAAPTEAPTVPPPTAAPLPDLYISEYTVTPDPCVEGSPCHIRIGVYNGGNAAAGAFRAEWWATISAPGAACTWDVPSLVAHGGQILECDYTYGGWARYTTRAIADPGNTVAESNEGNNNWDKEMTPEHSSLSVVTLSPVSRGQVDSGGSIRTNANNAGDIGIGNRGLQGFLTFDVSSIPDGATIESARLETVIFDTLGDPFGSLSCLRVYVHNYGTLDAGDYTPPPVTGAIARFCSTAELNDASVQELNSLGISGIQSALASNQFQIRLQFNTRETDGDGVDDVVRANFRLVVRYR